MTTVTKCRSCAAEVIFIPSATSGKPMILDKAPRKGVILEQNDMGGYGITPEQAEPNRGDLVARVVNVYTDHHATCPDAGSWKGRTR